MQLGNSLTCEDYNSYILMIVVFSFTQISISSIAFWECLKNGSSSLFFLTGKWLNCPLTVHIRHVLNPEMTFSLHPIERDSKTAELVPTCLPLHPPPSPQYFQQVKLVRKSVFSPPKIESLMSHLNLKVAPRSLQHRQILYLRCYFFSLFSVGSIEGNIDSSHTINVVYYFFSLKTQ